MPETSINITERLQKIGQTAQDYKDAIVNQFKDMEVEVKDWNLKSYCWENGKLCIKKGDRHHEIENPEHAQ